MLFTAYLKFRPEGHREPRNELNSVLNFAAFIAFPLSFDQSSKILSNTSFNMTAADFDLVLRKTFFTSNDC